MANTTDQDLPNGYYWVAGPNNAELIREKCGALWYGVGLRLPVTVDGCRVLGPVEPFKAVNTTEIVDGSEPDPAPLYAGILRNVGLDGSCRVDIKGTGVVLCRTDLLLRPYDIGARVTVRNGRVVECAGYPDRTVPVPEHTAHGTVLDSNTPYEARPLKGTKGYVMSYDAADDQVEIVSDDGRVWYQDAIGLQVGKRVRVGLAQRWVLDAYGDTDEREILSEIPCPECAHTDHPGQYVGLAFEVETCRRCNGAKVIDG